VKLTHLIAIIIISCLCLSVVIYFGVGLALSHDRKVAEEERQIGQERAFKYWQDQRSDGLTPEQNKAQAQKMIDDINKHEAEAQKKMHQ
jgi:hypothetical protein